MDDLLKSVETPKEARNVKFYKNEFSINDHIIIIKV